MDVKGDYVFDVEQYPNFHCGTFLNIKTKELRTFCISKLNMKNDIVEYRNFIRKNVRSLIGFNNLGYDNSMIRKVLEYKNFDELYEHSSKMSRKMKSGEYIYPVNLVGIHSLDLFKVHHLDNDAKRCSLKWIQFAIRFKSIVESLLPFDKDVTLKDVKDIIRYNVNDVYSTFELFNQSQKQIELRKNLKKVYPLDFTNWNDVKIGEEIVAYELAQILNVTVEDIKRRKTRRETIVLNDIILPYIKFENKEFNDLLEFYKKQTITKTKNVFEDLCVKFKGIEYDYGNGGLHASTKAGVYIQTGKKKIKDIDVKSFYPNLSIENDLFPEHLTIAFCLVYRNLFKRRIEAQKMKNRVLDAGFKLALNGTFGKSNSSFSFLYDPQFTMAITINGQLLLSMLIEKLSNVCEILQANTDGVTVMYDDDKEADILAICKEWETLTKLQLEYAEYDKMIISNVNNYLGVFTDGSIKYKGWFEIDKEIKGQPQYHKDHSHRIIPIALKEYFMNGIPVETTIKNHKDVFDFCIGVKTKKSEKKGNSCYVLRSIEGTDIAEEALQKVNRFVVTKSGKNIIKKYGDNTEEEVLSHPQKGRSFKAKVLNDYNDETVNELNLDYQYYIREANKVIQGIVPQNYSMF